MLLFVNNLHHKGLLNAEERGIAKSLILQYDHRLENLFRTTEISGLAVAVKQYLEPFKGVASISQLAKNAAVEENAKDLLRANTTSINAASATGSNFFPGQNILNSSRIHTNVYGAKPVDMPADFVPLSAAPPPPRPPVRRF